MAARLLQVAIAFDQFANCLISLAIGGGWADETISARMWRNRAVPGWRESRWLVDKLFWPAPSLASEVREIFKGFKIEEVQLRYSMSRNGKARGKEHTELLGANY